MFEPLPALFFRIPPTLFKPLGGNTPEVYWEILAALYRYEFEREPVYLVREVAQELAEQVLAASATWRAKRDALLSADETGLFEEAQALDEPALVKETARRLLARLERAGWFEYDYRSSQGQVLSFFPHAARILETLVRVARDEQPVFQGYAHAIASFLEPAPFAAKPGLSLREAKRSTLELVRELKILDRNIHRFIQKLLDEVSTAAGVLEEGVDRYRQAVLANYHRLKTVDNLYRVRGAVLARLDTIERDENSLESAARWYAEQHSVDLAAAASMVREDLRILRSQFETLPQVTDEIDARNARFSGVARRKLLYLLRQDRRTEGQLQYLADRLARDEAPDLPFEVFRCQLLADGFLYTEPRRRPKAEPHRIERAKPADTETLRKEIARRVLRPFSRQKVETFVREFLDGRSSRPLDDLFLDGDEDYVRLLFLAAYGQDGASSFALVREKGRRVSRGAYSHPAGTLEKKGKRR